MTAMTEVTIREEPILAGLAAHARIGTAYTVERVLQVTVHDGGLGGMTLVERPVAVPWVKDYAADDGDEGVAAWPQMFDLSRWGLLVAERDGQRVGGAVIAFDTPGVDMLERRRDLAVLWDIRVSSAARGQGVGTALFRATREWAQARGCRQLKVETQNVNVPACRFYARQGCRLGAINRFGYPELPDEVMLLWYLDLN